MQKSKFQFKIQNFKFLIVVLSFEFLILNFYGCATTPLVIPPKPQGIPGIYHRVERGQTLFRISKIYNTDINELVKINHIWDVTNIEVGQLIFIPYQQSQLTSYNKSSLIEDFIWPVKGEVVRTFGQTYNGTINKGINIKPYRHKDNVVAARSGKVVFYNPDLKGFGKTIIIDHGDGFLTIYAGTLEEVFVKIGDNTRKGELIAKTGLNLHFQIRKGYIPQNPYFYLPQK